MNIIAKLKRANKLLQAIEFDTKEAYDAYMKEHPAADPKNHSIKPQQQEQQLSELKEEELKEIASNPDTPISTLEKLSKNDNEFVRADVALNENTPVHMLEKLSKDYSMTVRASVAANENTPIPVLEKLSRDVRRFVRKQVALNKNTPIDLVLHLRNDPETRVSQAAVDALFERDEELFDALDFEEYKDDILEYYEDYIEGERERMEERGEDTSNFIENIKSFKDVLNIIGNYNKPDLLFYITDSLLDRRDYVDYSNDFDKDKFNDITNSIDLSKMSPELRERFEQMTSEEQYAFLLWLKENK